MTFSLSRVGFILILATVLCLVSTFVSVKGGRMNERVTYRQLLVGQIKRAQIKGS